MKPSDFFKKGDNSLFDEVRRFSRMSVIEYVLTLVAMISVLLVVVVYIFNSFYKVVKDQTLNDSLTNVGMVAERLDNILVNAIDAANVTSYSLENLIEPTYEDMQKYLSTQSRIYSKNVGGNFSAVYAQYDSIFVNGAGWVPPEGFSALTRPWFVDAVKNLNNVSIISPYVDSSSKQWVISVSRPLAEGRGVLAIDMRMGVFAPLVQNIQQIGLRNSFIVSRSGFVMASADSSIVGKNFLEKEQWLTEEANLVKLLLQNDRNFKQDSLSNKRILKVRMYGENQIVMYRVVQDDFFVVLVVDENELYESVQKILILSIIMALFVILVVSAFVTTSFINGAVASRAAREQLKMKKELQKNFDIIKTLASTFDSVSYVDVASGRVIPYSMGDTMRSKIGAMGNSEFNYNQGMALLIHSIVHKDDMEMALKESALDYAIETLKKRPSYFYQCRVLENGVYRYHKIIFIKSNLDEDVSSFVVAFADIDDEVRQIEKFQQELESEKNRAEEANMAKSSFLVNMSHEIRTPINAIMGMNEMILRESGEGQIRSYSEDIRGASQMLLSIINDILDFSKIEAGKMDIVEARYDMGAVLNDVVNMIGVKAEQKGLKLVVDVDRNIPSILVGDSIRIRQVMLNLLNNAVKYTEVGSVTFKVKIDGLLQDPKIGEMVTLLISVEDTGIGIKEEDLTRLFKSFQRLDLVQNRAIEGTGLGLAITSKLVEFMHGQVGVSSVYGKGSVFTVKLPQTVVNSAPVGDLQSRSQKAQKGDVEMVQLTAPTAKALVVDDNGMNLRVAKHLLKFTEMEISVCSSGMECLEMMKKERFDIIFLDHMMPGMDGIETLKLSKKLQGSLCEGVPVIALTANAIVGAREMYLEAGFDGYIGKPIRLDEMEQVLREFLPKEKIIDKLSNSAELVTPLIDESVGLEYCSGNREFYIEALNMYVEAYGENVARLKKDFETKDWHDYVIAAHSIKGNSLMIGAKALSELAKVHEFAGRDGNEELIQNRFEEFLAAYGDVCTACERIIGRA